MPLKIAKRKGSPYWQIVGAVAGQRVRESSGTAQRSLAESLRIKREAELENRRVHGPQSVATFAEVVNVYLDKGGEGRYLAPVLEALGTRVASELRPADIARVARQFYPNAPASTINRNIYTPFIAAMNAAAEEELVPFRKWRRPKGWNKRTRFRWLWPAELEDVWRAAPPHGRVVLDLLAGTGLRESEAAFLDWADVNLALRQGWIWTAKNDEPRRIELPERTAASLAGVLHRDGPVLLNEGGAPYVVSEDGGGAFAKGLQNWCRDANVKPFGAHVLRHTWATWFYSFTLDTARLKALGGWLSDESERYVHLAPRGLKDELLRFGWDFSGAAQSCAPYNALAASA